MDDYKYINEELIENYNQAIAAGLGEDVASDIAFTVKIPYGVDKDGKEIFQVTSYSDSGYIDYINNTPLPFTYEDFENDIDIQNMIKVFKLESLPFWTYIKDAYLLSVNNRPNKLEIPKSIKFMTINNDLKITDKHLLKNIVETLIKNERERIENITILKFYDKLQDFLKKRKPDEAIANELNSFTSINQFISYLLFFTGIDENPRYKKFERFANNKAGKALGDKIHKIKKDIGNYQKKELERTYF